MGLFVDTDWKYRGLQVVRIENEHIRLDVFPEVGAKIYNFIHKDSNRNLLWHNSRIPPSRVAYGALFDDHWCGGWDELVPNDMPFPAPSGEMLPDHGELRRRSALGKASHSAAWIIPTQIWEQCRSISFGISVAHLKYRPQHAWTSRHGTA
jgi:hypothetical protein